jgi:hypothetical protein
VTEAEFRQVLEGFWAWTSQRERPVEQWLSSLYQWAEEEAGRAKRKAES